MHEITVNGSSDKSYSLTVCDLNDKVFVLLDRSLIVSATVNELSNIYISPSVHNGKRSFWGYISNERAEYAIPTEEVDEGGWSKYKVVTELPNNAILCNQFIWVDEPFGHGIQIGDEAFATLDEAMSIAVPTRKKHLRRRLQRWRRLSIEFIASTHGLKGAQDSAQRMRQVFMKPKGYMFVKVKSII